MKRLVTEALALEIMTIARGAHGEATERTECEGHGASLGGAL